MAEVIIIGGGPAGLAAAGTLAKAGIASTLLEQRATLGGAIHRQPVGSAKSVAVSTAARHRFERLMQGIATPLVRLRASTTFLGIDGDGCMLTESRTHGTVAALKADAVILATGAVEKIRPVPGWDLPGVSTAGGLQVMLKETGTPPKGRILLAGNGPLLIALAAQMIRAGNPPLMIVEAGNPLAHPVAAFGLLAHTTLLREATGYTLDVLRSGIPWKRGACLTGITARDDALEATILHADGRTEIVAADRIALHDGIRENDIGLPAARNNGKPIILKAGDCRQALGVFAAVADGERAGSEAASLLRGNKAALTRFERRIDRQVAAQRLLAHIFAPALPLPPLSALPDDCTLCRCEGRTVGDLKALLTVKDGLSGREVKHNGRFAMGSCQGRFCAANTAALMAALRPDVPAPTLRDLTGQRWPVRPVSIAALIGAASNETTNDHEVRS